MTTKTITRAAKSATPAKGLTGKSARKVATTKATEKAKAKAPAYTGKIVESKGTSGGEKHYVRADDGRSTMIPNAQWRGEVRAAAAVGQNYDEFCKVWSRVSAAKLANGVTSRAAPHSAKAIADAKLAKPAKATAAQRKAVAKAKADEAESKAFKLTEKGEAKLAKLDAKARASDKLQRMATAGSMTAALAISGISRGDVNYALRCKFLTY